MQLQTSTTTGIDSRLSLQPLVAVLRQMIREGKPGAAALYAPLLAELDTHPELLGPLETADALAPHAELVDTLLSTLFPPGSSATEGMYAVAMPFSHETIFASVPFRDRFIASGDHCISEPDSRTATGIARASQRMAYNLILRQFYGWDLPAQAASVYPFEDPETGLIHYLELELDARFVQVSVQDGFTLPTDYAVQRTLDFDNLRHTFPLEQFCFEGLVVINVDDVTSEQVIAEIKNTLLNVRAFSDVTVYDELQRHIQTFLGLPHVTVGITPFFRINGHYQFSELHYKNSILFRNAEVKAQRAAVAARCQVLFAGAAGPLLLGTVTPRDGERIELLPYYYNQGARSLILCPLTCDDGQLIGLLEISSEVAGYLRYPHLARIQSAVGLFTLALEKSIEALAQEIDRTIKEHFTAVQPAVEWKFTEAAFSYLEQSAHDEESASLPAITFPEVYPLYAQIDVRNSSQERSTAIRRDLVEQLESARDVLGAAGRIDFPLLKAVRFKISQYLDAIHDNLLSDDEMQIYDFLQGELQALMEHLRSARPELAAGINGYLESIDPDKKILYRHRRAYEESITRINEALERFIDKEQAQMQKIYPHYFERYVTDGIEFNMYVGQSLAPEQPFHEMYVSNLKLWQFTLLAKAALLAQVLEKRLPLPLRTTQLILAHSVPISISFRRKERKFDVDGAYNIRYEIVKKRIDKVHTRAGERLTQPGTIAIVYSQQKELHEYLGYVEYLRSEGLVEGDPEFLDLEELQGVSGLKAMRVRVQPQDQTAPVFKRTGSEINAG
ncbi:hypothetical protein [Flaviaesturariibacter amylovorans]|uniref:GAF domain-containing protein n=1 Tax=Flaviaesturariibacter amylovorans TaxID=1084520 RepID=A0ABP8G484_9BACT